MFSAIVTAIGNLLTSVFNFRAEKIKNIASVEVVEDKQDYQKAVKTAEKKWNPNVKASNIEAFESTKGIKIDLVENEQSLPMSQKR